MISKEEIKKVEQLQKIEKEIKDLKEDYKDVKLSIDLLAVRNCHNNKYLNNDYSRELSRIIYHRIKKLERKRKNMLKGEQKNE